MKTTAAVVHEKDAAFALEQVDLEDPRPNEVLVRLVATGMCHTDLNVRSGVIPFPLPAVVGHEGAGIVEQVGSAVQRVRPGDHVLASFTSRGTCVFIGAPSARSTVPVDVNYMRLGRRVIGLAMGGSVPQVFLPALVRLHELGKLPIERPIKRYPFEDIERAAADALSGATIKPVIVFD